MHSKPFEIVEAAVLGGYGAASINAMLRKANKLTSGRYDIDLFSGMVPIVQLLPGLAYVHGTDLTELSDIVDGVINKDAEPINAIDMKTAHSLRWMIDDFTAIYCDKDKWPVLFNSEERLSSNPKHLANLVCLLRAVKHDLKPITVIRGCHEVPGIV